MSENFPESRYLQFHVERVHQCSAKPCRNGHRARQTFHFFVKHLTEKWMEERAHLFHGFMVLGIIVEGIAGLHSLHSRGWKQGKNLMMWGFLLYLLPSHLPGSGAEKASSFLITFSMFLESFVSYFKYEHCVKMFFILSHLVILKNKHLCLNHHSYCILKYFLLVFWPSQIMGK